MLSYLQLYIYDSLSSTHSLLQRYLICNFILLTTLFYLQPILSRTMLYTTLIYLQLSFTYIALLSTTLIYLQRCLMYNCILYTTRSYI